MATSDQSARGHIATAIDGEKAALRELNLQIHSHPEVAYEEVFAHDTLSDFLEARGFTVTRHAHGLDTSFEAEYGQGGRLVVICAEYDALPGIGHGCGHNLIATSSMAAFLGLVKALQESKVAGRVRILGTPAEEGGGGKAKLIDAGAFTDDIAAAIMSHPTSTHQFPHHHGLAGFKTIASHKLRVEFHGRGAHAGGEPWMGLNALDAAVAAYNNVSMLRQHIQPDERIHGVIEAGGTAPNVIPDYTRMNWFVRSPNTLRADALLARVKACFEAAAVATGCTLSYIP
jgi:amidohydrolase